MTEKGYKPEPRLFATAARGTEGALRDELRELRFRGVRADRGGVHFAGELDEGFRACLELRTALRVLYRLDTFDAPDGDALYDGVAALDWDPYFTPKHTLAVRAVCRDSALTHSQFIAQRTKDAIVDQLRRRTGERPSVDLADPDVVLFVHIVRDVATVYLDLSGESLHRRGYRLEAGDAPIKENLAAAILRLSGWDRERPLIDPMCGSGTIAIEAAMWARRIAPGLARKRFSVERWASHGDAAAKLAAEIRDEVRSRELPEDACPPISGRDVDLATLAAAVANARAAGVKVPFARGSVKNLEPGIAPGVIVTNPPYGERLEAPEEMLRDMGRAFGQMRGYRIAVLAGSPDVLRVIRLRPTKTLTVFNGDIECRLVTYDVAG